MTMVHPEATDERAPPTPGIAGCLAHWTRTSTPSELREILPLLARPGLLSFALGMPASELLPRAAFMRAAQNALTADGLPLQYGVPSDPLKRQIAAMLMERGVECRPEEVFLTSGAQQGLSLISRLLLDEGGCVAMETTVYDGIHGAVKPSRPQVLGIPSDEGGLDVDALETMLEAGARPAFVYVIPEGHNPLGVSLSLERRLRLVALARRFRVPLVEDDAYGFLRYDGRAVPALRALDPEWVLYVGSFSKIFAPSIRVGWIVAPESLVPTLSILKHGSDLDVTTLAQRCLSEFIATGLLPEHLAALRAEYRARRDAMLGALERYFPPTVRWSTPDGGMFVWVRLPAGSDAVSLLRRAVETEQVAFVPGAAFCAGNSALGVDCLRLCFASTPPERIVDGIARLGSLLTGPGAVRVPSLFREDSAPLACEF